MKDKKTILLLPTTIIVVNVYFRGFIHDAMIENIKQYSKQEAETALMQINSNKHIKDAIRYYEGKMNEILNDNTTEHCKRVSKMLKM